MMPEQWHDTERRKPSECPITAECAGRMLEQLENLEKDSKVTNTRLDGIVVAQEKAALTMTELKISIAKNVRDYESLNTVMNRMVTQQEKTNDLLNVINLNNATNKGYISGGVDTVKVGFKLWAIIIGVVASIATAISWLSSKINIFL